MKKLLATLLALTMVLTAAAGLADTIKMGTNAAFEPFEYIGDSGQPEGFDVEIGKLIAADLGMELEIVDMYFDGLLAALDTGMIDFVIAAMTINDERKEAALFSEPYFSDAAQAVIVVKGYEGIKTVEDIADKKVAAQDGTTGFMMATDSLGCDPANVAPFKASTDTILELTSGRADCVIIDLAVAQNFVALYGDQIEIVEGLDMPQEQYGVAVKMGNDELLASINATISKIMEDGTYDALYAEYFGEEEQ